MEKLACMFPGQGSQYPGMGEQLWSASQSVKEVFEEASSVLGFDVADLCFKSDAHELTRTENAQPAILTVSYATYKYISEKYEIQPSYLAGHSLGEYTALVCAGVLSFKDALLLVRKRGQLMSEASKKSQGVMYAVSGMTRDRLESELSESSVVISNYNSPNQYVISGRKNETDDVSRRLTESGAVTVPLKVSAPFHCSLMDETADLFKSELKKVKFSKPQVEIISNVNGKPYTEDVDWVDVLSRHITQPVMWEDSMKTMIDLGAAWFVELGPKSVLTKLAKPYTDKISAHSYDKESENTNFHKRLLKHNPGSRASRTHRISKMIEKCVVESVSTKNLNWNVDEYKDGVVAPLMRMNELLRDYESDLLKPNSIHGDEAIELLKRIMDTKGVPANEQALRIESVMKTTDMTFSC